MSEGTSTHHHIGPEFYIKGDYLEQQAPGSVVELRTPPGWSKNPHENPAGASNWTTFSIKKDEIARWHSMYLIPMTSTLCEAKGAARPIYPDLQDGPTNAQGVTPDVGREGNARTNSFWKDQGGLIETLASYNDLRGAGGFRPNSGWRGIGGLRGGGYPTGPLLDDLQNLSNSDEDEDEDEDDFGESGDSSYSDHGWNSTENLDLDTDNSEASKGLIDLEDLDSSNTSTLPENSDNADTSTDPSDSDSFGKSTESTEDTDISTKPASPIDQTESPSADESDSETPPGAIEPSDSVTETSNTEDSSTFPGSDDASADSSQRAIAKESSDDSTDSGVADSFTSNDSPADSSDPFSFDSTDNDNSPSTSEENSQIEQTEPASDSDRGLSDVSGDESSTSEGDH
jgi:hypothetical protein